MAVDKLSHLKSVQALVDIVTVCPSYVVLLVSALIAVLGCTLLLSPRHNNYIVTQDIIILLRTSSRIQSLE